MEEIKDVTIGVLENSQFIKPVCIEYSQNGEKKVWDAISVQPGVLILIYNKTRDVLVLVKQFRPAVYASSSNITGVDGCIDNTVYPACNGMTLELCAGLVDKDKTLPEIAKDELLEECGYDVPLENIQKLTEYRDDPDISGVLHVIYYAVVTDAMKVGPGGGNPSEGEFIEVVEIPVSEALDVAMDESKQKPFSVTFAVLWFYRNIYNK